MSNFEPGTRVRRVGNNVDPEVPLGSIGTVLKDEKARERFNWIRVEWDGIPPNQLAALVGMRGHLHTETEIEEL